MSGRTAIVTTFNNPDDFEDAFEDIESDDTIYSKLDLDNRCTHPGGHVWLGCASLRPFCIYCGERAE
jgi:hypothetical protein